MSRAEARWVEDSWCLVTLKPIPHLDGERRRIRGFWRKRYVYPFLTFELASFVAKRMNQR